VDLLGALRQPRCWIADVGPGWAVERLWIIPFAKVPSEVLPKPDALLTPELERAIALSGTGSRSGVASARVGAGGRNSAFFR
jgi:hypothetical protein